METPKSSSPANARLPVPAAAPHRAACTAALCDALKKAGAVWHGLRREELKAGPDFWGTLHWIQHWRFNNYLGVIYNGIIYIYSTNKNNLSLDLFKTRILACQPLKLQIRVVIDPQITMNIFLNRERAECQLWWIDTCTHGNWSIWFSGKSCEH